MKRYALAKKYAKEEYVMAESPSGDYVLHADVESALARAKAMEEALAKVPKLCALHSQAGYNTYPDEKLNAEIEAMEKEIFRAALARDGEAPSK